MKIQGITPAFIEYHSIRGSFGQIKYFSTKTSLRDAAENLQLLPQETLSFKERIQRMVDIDRVEKELVPYLIRDPFRFFNSLVCILLPDENQKQGYWDFTPYTDEEGNEHGGLGKLRISKDVSRVVLDGQHRFKALEKFWAQKSNELGFEEIEIPIVFVLADNIGQLNQNAQRAREETIEVVRHLFTVINKSVKKVDRNTLLLIDDYNVSNVIARKLIEDNVIDEKYVKWTSGENLQNSDPYFYTLHTIRDVIEFFLSEYLEKERLDGIDRQKVNKCVEKYYENPLWGKKSGKDLFNTLFNENIGYKTWTKIITENDISIKQQPESTQLTSPQRKSLESNRKLELINTVAGQKAFFYAIITAFRTGKSLSFSNFEGYLKAANDSIESGNFRRNRKKANPFLHVLFDEREKMLWSGPSVDLARRILAAAIGGGVNKDAILEDYHERTEQPKSLLHDYWMRSSDNNELTTQ